MIEHSHKIFAYEEKATTTTTTTTTTTITTGGGFYLVCEDFWENVRQFIPRLRFFFFF